MREGDQQEALVECLTALIDCRERWDEAGFVGTPDHINDLLDRVRARAIPGIEWKTDHPDNDYIESVALAAPPHLLQDEQGREAAALAGAVAVLQAVASSACFDEDLREDINAAIEAALRAMKGVEA